MGNRHFAFWPPKVPRHLTLPETSLWFNVEVASTRFPNKACTIFYDSVVTYAEFKAEVERLAGFLQNECGVAPGERVALFMQNCPQFVMAYYAVLRADAVVVPINPMNMKGELEYMLADSGAQVIFAAQDRLSEVEPLLGTSALKRVIVVHYADALTAKTDLTLPDFLTEPPVRVSGPGVIAYRDAVAQGSTPRPPRARADDLCVMPYTSGTTGHPKGCMHTHRTVMHTAMATSHWHRTFHDETVLAAVPMFHVTGMQNAMNGPLYAGATIAILPRWDRDVAAALIERFKVTAWTSVPTMVVDLLSSPNVERYDLSSLRSMGGGGAAMPEAIATKLERLTGLTYQEGYGLSETAAATHINPAQRMKKQCLGIPIFGVDSRVVAPDTLKECLPGDPGEILTHGPQVFLGYWNKPKANEECFVEIDGKRFFRTGDLARTDDDGYFFMVDRIKRMINASGFKVWPAEVEALLYAHPSIQEAAVISKRDPRRGETVKAVIVLDPSARDHVTEADILTWARGQMAAYKVPRSIEFTEALPKSGSGKILWRELQEVEDRRSE